jgi:hypothetical protein
MDHGIIFAQDDDSVSKYDAWGRLTETSSVLVSYLYDGLGRKVVSKH